MKVREVLVVAVIIINSGFPRTSKKKKKKKEGSKKGGKEKSRLSLSVGLLVVDVAANTTSVYTFWAEEDSIAWFMAVGLTIMLCVASCCQGLTAPLAAETRPMPVLPQRRHLLSEIDLLAASGAQVGFPREGGDASSFRRWP